MLNWGQLARPALPPAGTQQECSRDLARLRSQEVQRGPKGTFAFIGYSQHFNMGIAGVLVHTVGPWNTKSFTSQSRPSSSRVNYGEAETIKNLLAYHRSRPS